MNVHLIAIGGSAMHNLAIALHTKGHVVTGSDDAIFSPSKERLESYNLLPKSIGWFAEKITNKLDAVILGMHAKHDNPELIKAQKLKIPIFSYPEYIYNESKNKKRVVIGGSHGKTSITSMILHVLKSMEYEFDYLVGSQIEGFNNMIKLTKDAPIIILEGDEYLSSPIDRRPKFHLYKPDIAVISGIAWDHINVFPTFEMYVDQFRKFKNMITSTLIYCSEDQEVSNLAKEPTECKMIPYGTPEHNIKDGITSISGYDLMIFGNHNLQNLNAARLVCNEIGINNIDFYKHISYFKGAAKRLELVKKNKYSAIYKDFAHSPSKLKATCKAMKSQFKNRKLVACIELYTFSSLNKDFLQQYEESMNAPDTAIVYFNKEAIKQKKISEIKKEDVYIGFNRNDLIIFTEIKKLKDYLISIDWKDANLLMMSSGNFNNIKIDDII